MIPTIFTASCLWKGPNDSEKIIYFSGTSKQEITNVSLVDSLDNEYPEGTAYKLVGTNADDLGRVYDVTSADKITLNVSTNITYGIDDYKNLIIFDTAINVSNVLANIERYYASLHSSNLVSFNKVIDLKFHKERAITSLVATTDGIYMSGISGKIWFYNGDYVKGPIFILQDNSSDISASAMISHKFEHEAEAYLYVGSDQLPRLFRAKLSSAYNGSEWEQVYPQGELAAVSGGILSLGSAYNKLFIGCRNKKVHKYSRNKSIVLSQPTNLVTEEVIENEVETETLSTSTLYSNNIGDFESSDFGVKSLSVGKNQIFAGIDKKPEIWVYSEIPVSNPETEESWSSLIFDEQFLADPAPAQYYSYDSNTLSRNDANIGVAHFVDNNAPGRSIDFLAIKGNTVDGTGTTAYGSRFFEFAEGSDWEQLIAANLPDQAFIDIQCASYTSISSWNNFTALDGYTLKTNDLFILKDPGASGVNGIYNGLYKYNDDTSDPSIVSISNYIISGNSILGFYIQNGYINIASRYLLNYDNVLSTGQYNFYKPSYTIEADMINLSKSSAMSSTDLRDVPALYTSEQILQYSYNGYQGIEVSDLYGNFQLEFNTENVRLSSGTNVVNKSLITTGLVKDWEFYSVSSEVVSSSTEDWTARNFVSSLTAETESNFDIFNNTVSKYVLKVTPTLTGNPSIQITGLSLDVDIDTVIKIKAKIAPKAQNLSNASIRAYWAFSDGNFSKFSETEIHSTPNYQEYVIKPVWNGTIDRICLEFANLPENFQRPDFICIEYIQVLSSENIFDLNNKLSKVRVTVEGKDVKVYLGSQYSPFIEMKNFITLDTYNPKYIQPTLDTEDYDKPYIRFGKLSNDASDSMFGYQKLSFIFGQALSPVNVKTIDFHQSVKLPSTGGVRLFTYHDGTLYCATDGFISSKLSENPDDRQGKIFYYDSNSETWFLEDVPFDRKKIFDNAGNYDILGIVRPLTSLSYKGRLFLSGHYGSIKTV